MQVYWREVRKGQRLVLEMEDGAEQEVGGVRATKRGFDAFAQTFGYDPGGRRRASGRWRRRRRSWSSFVLGAARRDGRDCGRRSAASGPVATA